MEHGDGRSAAGIGRQGRAGGVPAIYAWEVPTISLGYFQHHADRRTHEPSRSRSLLPGRRAAGNDCDRPELSTAILPSLGRMSLPNCRICTKRFTRRWPKNWHGTESPPGSAEHRPGDLESRSRSCVFSGGPSGTCWLGTPRLPAVRSAASRHAAAAWQRPVPRFGRSPRTGGNHGTLVRRDRSKGTGRVRAERVARSLGLKLRPAAASAEELEAADRFRLAQFTAASWTNRR